ncbi:hypothetical protein LDENG_00037600 [Lucifuga dentata]|nr:hypothetical protein LDENG_00037600 [Lucifuga dentata]
MRGFILFCLLGLILTDQAQSRIPNCPGCIRPGRREVHGFQPPENLKNCPGCTKPGRRELRVMDLQPPVKPAPDQPGNIRRGRRELHVMRNQENHQNCRCFPLQWQQKKTGR